MTCWKFLYPCTRTFPLWKLSFLVASPPQIFNSSSRPYQKWSIFGRGDLMNCFQTGTQLTQWSRKRVLILTSWVRTPWRRDFSHFCSFFSVKSTNHRFYWEELTGYRAENRSWNGSWDGIGNGSWDIWSRAGPASRLVIRTSAMAGNFSASMLTPHTYTLRPSGILLTQTVVFWEKKEAFSVNPWISSRPAGGFFKKTACTKNFSIVC